MTTITMRVGAECKDGQSCRSRRKEPISEEILGTVWCERLVAGHSTNGSSTNRIKPYSARKHLHTIFHQQCDLYQQRCRPCLAHKRYNACACLCRFDAATPWLSVRRVDRDLGTRSQAPSLLHSYFDRFWFEWTGILVDDVTEYFFGACRRKACRSLPSSCLIDVLHRNPLFTLLNVLDKLTRNVSCRHCYTPLTSLWMLMIVSASDRWNRCKLPEVSCDLFMLQ